MSKQKYYAVRVGKNTGIFNTWEECKNNIFGFKGAIYKSFPTLDEAESFMNSGKIDKAENMDAIFYVDGSYDIRSGSFSYGIVVLKDDNEILLNKKYENSDLSSMRNVAGEIMGARSAIEYALEHGYKNIEIHFDYEGIEKWALGLWKTNKDGTIEYKKFYDGIKNEINVHFVKVKGHSGDKYNDLADRLAKDALGIK